MSKTYMQKEDKKGKRTGNIICISLSDWARYRQSGYAFVEAEEPDEDGKLGRSPEQQFLAQDNGPSDRKDNAEAAKDKHASRVAGREGSDDNDDDDDDVPTMANKKPEIIAYLVENEIDHDENSTKAELLELI